MCAVLHLMTSEVRFVEARRLHLEDMRKCRMQRGMDIEEMGGLEARRRKVCQLLPEVVDARRTEVRRSYREAMETRRLEVRQRHLRDAAAAIYIEHKY